MLHGHDLDRTLDIGLTMDPAPGLFSAGLGARARRFGFSFIWDSETQTVRQTGARLGLDHYDIAVYTRRRGPAVARNEEQAGRRDFPFRLGQKEARQTFVSWLLSSGRSTFRLRNDALMKAALADRSEFDRLVSALVDGVTFAASSWSIVPVLPQFRLSDSARPDKPFKDLVEALQLMWRQRSASFRSELAACMDSLVYLGPLRRAPARFQVITGARRTSVGREGEFAAEILRRRDDVLPRVNHWLDRLQIPYSVEALPLLAEDLSTTIGDVVVLVLTDLRSGLKVSPGDVGFGISQLLPIVVQTLVGTDNVVCIEQPEIHVHPRLQADVADLFVESLRGHRGNQLIIETHSEHMMLRIQRHVAAGKIAPEDVAVLYVDNDDRGAASVIRLRMSESGDFLDEWPRGFFEERFDEGLRPTIDARQCRFGYCRGHPASR